MKSHSGSEDGSAMYVDEGGDLNESFELRDLHCSHGKSGSSSPDLSPELEDCNSDERRISPGVHTSTIASASALQNVMLYTPDEEQSIIRKFDRRLVLFVALLYMLSFLDRSSMFPLFID